MTNNESQGSSQAQSSLDTHIVPSDRWERHSQWALTAFALIFLTLYGWDVIGDLKGAGHSWASFGMNAIWAIFAVDYVIRLALSKRKLHWFIHHLVDLAIVALPLLRPLRLLQLINLVKILGKSASATFRGKLALYSSASVFLLVLVGSLAVLDAERGEPNTLIHDFPDALWWAVCTITTVGYGDLYPISWTGRAIAVCMMVAGVALIGVVTASIASWIVETIETNSDAREATLEDEITALRAEINALRQQLSPATNPNSMSENHASNG